MKELEKTFDIPLHDIKTIVEIPEYSLYYLIALSIISVLVISALIYLLLKYLENKRKYNVRKEHFKLLNLVDLSNTKKAAYAISFYGATFKNDGERQVGMYENITQRLEQFKYKKDVESFDEETLGFIELYKEMIDV